MSGVPPSLSPSQRPPLRPRLAHSDPNMKMPDSDVTAKGPPTLPASVCKRHNPDQTTELESENCGGSCTVVGALDPKPTLFPSKRQRTASGSESIGASGSEEVNVVTSVHSVMDCGVRLGEPLPLCEHNARTSKMEQHSDISLNGQVTESGCECSEGERVDLNNGTPNGYVDNEDQCNSNHEGHNGRVGENATGGLSPNCAATLEYVAQLPEGCSGKSSSEFMNPPVPVDSDNELDDDDNYLDSSDGEGEEELTVTNNEEDESCGEDDQSVISCITVGSTSSLRSIASEVLNNVCINEHGVASNEDGSLLYSDAPADAPVPAFSCSLFSHVSPAINFCQYNERTAPLPAEISRLLKWKITNITPLIVKKTVISSGFKGTKKTVQWCGTWGKHMKSVCFKGLKEFQKLNHFPATFQIGRKDKLWKNFARLQAKFGKEEFGFIPKTFVLPSDLRALKAAFDKEGVKKKWIIKPPASARGTGIQVVHKWSQIPTDQPLVVQRYITKPYLINETKFDIRIYVLVTSFHPLRIYLYQDGLVRFASVQYNKASKTLGDRFMHLTNYSVNKTSSSYTHNADAGQCQGHKWTLRALWGYLKAKGIDTQGLWNRIADMVIKSIISGEHDIVARTRLNVRSRYSCQELFGFDVMVDEKLRPWLLEVNISPSLHSATQLDHSVKGPLIRDLLNIATFHIPDKLSQHQQAELLAELDLGENVTGLCLDRRMYTRLISCDDQVKHLRVNSLPRNQYLTAILDDINSDDLRHLITAEDELNRAGKFSRIFPTSETYPYLNFIDKPRYYNRLMDAWETMYASMREKGIERLEKLCKEKVHLQVPPAFKLPKAAILPPTEGVKQVGPVLGQGIRAVNCGKCNPCPSRNEMLQQQEQQYSSHHEQTDFVDEHASKEKVAEEPSSTCTESS
ncbi:tubulin polyglutamylase ttll-4-like isoform X2 [Oratosquilla oratoria]|uniref:tubulin polyglutamylase ttll-4-like isoform X2 n=1 Tax=Oratosquilla oratoria TaxID=337810 RepID=UPI003F7666BD